MKRKAIAEATITVGRRPGIVSMRPDHRTPPNMTVTLARTATLLANARRFV